jgi:NAD-dependent SIR2 family protein deacetylase
MSSSVIEAAARIKDARRVVYLCGAGLSVPSGVRAYRSGPNAVWAEHVTEWGTRQRFLEETAAWWSRFWLDAHKDLVRPGRVVEPNAGHRALTALARRDGACVITQNIDGLQRLAGIDEDRFIEIHGRHDRYVCASDGGCEGIDQAVEQVDLSRVDEGIVPTCARCGAPMRPLVLLFDELYDWHPAFQAFRARKLLNDAQVLVFVGTSFSVGITSYAVRCAEASGAKVYSVNVEPAPTFVGAVDLLGGAEEVLPQLLAEAG